MKLHLTLELGKASLYYYFPTKEELFKAVITLEQTELKNDIELILQAKKPATQKLHGYVKAEDEVFPGSDKSRDSQYLFLL